jgi:hypothetical protein
VVAALVGGDQRAAARVVWDEVRAERLPPFGRLVEVSLRRANAPSTVGWPGRVFGPRSVGDGEWRLLVRCDDADLPAVAAAVQRAARSAKVRVTVA